MGCAFVFKNHGPWCIISKVRGKKKPNTAKHHEATEESFSLHDFGIMVSVRSYHQVKVLPLSCMQWPPLIDLVVPKGLSWLPHSLSFLGCR